MANIATAIAVSLCGILLSCGENERGSMESLAAGFGGGGTRGHSHPSPPEFRGCRSSISDSRLIVAGSNRIELEGDDVILTLTVLNPTEKKWYINKGSIQESEVTGIRVGSSFMFDIVHFSRVKRAQISPFIPHSIYSSAGVFSIRLPRAAVSANPYLLMVNQDRMGNCYALKDYFRRPEDLEILRSL